MVVEIRGRLTEETVAWCRSTPLIAVSASASDLEWLVSFCRANEVPLPFLLLTDASTAPEDAESFELTNNATSVDGWLQEVEERLKAPPADLIRALDLWDPDQRASVMTPPLKEGNTLLLGRVVLGRRRAEWARYEDKCFSVSAWGRAELPAPRSVVVPLEPAALRRAFRAIHAQDGVVISADATRGIHSGSSLVVRAAEVSAIDACCDRLNGRCVDVKVTEFVEGVSCSIHGMVFQDEVLAFRPIEQVVLRSPDGIGFTHVAGANAQWRPSGAELRETKSAAKRIGELLHREVGYQGCFGLDGILSSNGFQAVEINARMGGFISGGGPIDGVPLDLINALVMDGQLTTMDPQLLEYAMVGAIDAVKQTTLVLTLGSSAERPEFTAELAYSERQFELASATGSSDVTVTCLQRPVVGGMALLFEFPDRQLYRGVPISPFVVAVLDALGRLFDLDTTGYGCPAPQMSR